MDKLGLERVDTLAQFIDEFEAAGFSVERVREASITSKKMRDLGFDAGDLENILTSSSSSRKCKEGLSMLGKKKQFYWVGLGH